MFVKFELVFDEIQDILKPLGMRAVAWMKVEHDADWGKETLGKIRHPLFLIYKRIAGLEVVAGASAVVMVELGNDVVACGVISTVLGTQDTIQIGCEGVVPTVVRDGKVGLACWLLLSASADNPNSGGEAPGEEDWDGALCGARADGAPHPGVQEGRV